MAREFSYFLNYSLGSTDFCLWNFCCACLDASVLRSQLLCLHFVFIWLLEAFLKSLTSLCDVDTWYNLLFQSPSHCKMWSSVFQLHLSVASSESSFFSPACCRNKYATFPQTSLRFLMKTFGEFMLFFSNLNSSISCWMIFLFVNI